jgi:hypothetical protein
MKKWLWLSFALLLAILAYVGAGPWLTIRAIESAIARQDAAALSRQVDFPALRASLKLQLADRLVREAGPDAQSSPWGALGLTIASGMMGGAVDAMVTPLGLGAMMEGRKVWNRFDQGLRPAPAAAAGDALVASPGPLHDASYRYESPQRFTATVHDDDGRPVTFVLTRSGLQWRLSDIRLPLD